MKLISRKRDAMIVIAAGLLSLMATSSMAADALQSMKKCDAKVSRATDLAREVKSKKEKMCAAMPQDHVDGTVRAKMQEARSECFNELETEFRRTIEDVTQLHDECYEAIPDLYQ